MSDERLVELETKLAFQDRAIARLEEAVREQQKQIDKLRALCERLKARSEASSADDSRDEPPPPHYGGRAGE
jgi:SlyX protein